MKYGEKHLNKLKMLCEYDAQLLAGLPQNTVIIGADEVGRGSAIGPVTAAAVCFPLALLQQPPHHLVGLDDSKASYHNHHTRTELASVISSSGLFSIQEASQQEVEQLNVSQASLLASKRAILACYHSLPKKPETVLVLLDGKSILKGFSLEGSQTLQQAIVKGDGLSASIAAAAILAKVHRDNWVLELCKKHPEWAEYGWQTNMGYLTETHRKALDAHGRTPHHRSTYQYKSLQLSFLKG